MLDLVRNYVGDSLQFEIQWILKREETPSWVLGENRLGLSMWLQADALVADADDLCLLAEPAVERGS
jgi:predicted component of type VI protein secretion system